VSASLERNNLATPGSAIASMVLGIASLVTCFFYGVPGLVCGILAVIFAGKADRMIRTGAFSNQSRGMITAGRVCGWIGIALSSVFTLVLIGYFFLFAMLFTAAATGPSWLPPPQGHQFNTPPPVTPGAPSPVESVEEEGDQEPPDPAPEGNEPENDPAKPEIGTAPAP